MHITSNKNFNENIIQVCTLTADKPEDKIEKLYKEINGMTTYIMGDINAKIGKGRFENLVRPHEPGQIVGHN